MADEVDARPVFGELLKQSQSALAGLQALEEQLSSRLADQHAQLKATRAALEQERETLAALENAHQRLTADHVRTLDEAGRQRHARIELEAAILDVRRELADALEERQELIAARDSERRELEERLAHLETVLGDRLNRVATLEAQLGELGAAQVSWETERNALTETRDQLASRVGDLEASQRQAAHDLGRAIHNREQLRGAFEDLKRTHAAAAERSAAAFREMARLQDELQIAAEEAVAHERASEVLKDELARARASSDELQAHQLTWAADREALLASAQASEQSFLSLEAELAKARLGLAERTNATEAEVSQIRQQAAALQLHLAEEGERLQTALTSAQDELRRAVVATTAAEKGRADAQAQYASLLERAQAAAQDWGARRQSLAEENARLAEATSHAQQAQRAAEDGQRQMQAQMQELEQAHREKVAALQDRLRAAEDAAARPLTAEQSHRINTRLNGIVGFAEILLDPKANAITAEEQADYIRLIDDNSRGLAEDLSLVAVAGAAESPVSREAGGPTGASLRGNGMLPTVLVADPDPAVRERLLPFLTRAGYEVLFVSTQEEALRQAGARSPLLVLAEASLPSGGASALIAELKRDPRTADIPVVVTTRNTTDPLGVDLGQVDVLTKPIDRQQLLQMMINHDLHADARRARKLPARVLVIDDDPLSLRLLTAVLKPLQIQVTTASGGRAGIELAKQCNPQLIICDLTMPEVDGFSVIAALRADPETSAVPILVYTGKTITAEDQQRLQGLIPSIIRKGEFSRERFLEMLLKRGERRSRGAAPPIAA